MNILKFTLGILVSFMLSIFSNAAPQGRQKTEMSKAKTSAKASTRILIELDKQLLTFERGGEKKTYPISSGKLTTPTPTGKFIIQSKEENHLLDKISSENGVRIRMPYWMFIDEGRGIAIHGVYEFWGGRYPASGACIRMRMEDVSEIFRQIAIGTPVLITGSEKDYVEQNRVFPWQNSRAKLLLIARREGGYAFNKSVTAEMRQILHDLWEEGKLGAFRPTPAMIRKDPRWAKGDFINFPNIPEMGSPSEQSFDACKERYFTLQELEEIVGQKATLRDNW